MTARSERSDISPSSSHQVSKTIQSCREKFESIKRVDETRNHIIETLLSISEESLRLRQDLERERAYNRMMQNQLSEAQTPKYNLNSKLQDWRNGITRRAKFMFLALDGNEMLFHERIIVQNELGGSQAGNVMEEALRKIVADFIPASHNTLTYWRIHINFPALLSKMRALGHAVTIETDNIRRFYDGIAKQRILVEIVPNEADSNTSMILHDLRSFSKDPNCVHFFAPSSCHRVPGSQGCPHRVTYLDVSSSPFRPQNDLYFQTGTDVGKNPVYYQFPTVLRYERAKKAPVPVQSTPVAPPAESFIDDLLTSSLVDVTLSDPRPEDGSAFVPDSAVCFSPVPTPLRKEPSHPVRNGSMLDKDSSKEAEPTSNPPGSPESVVGSAPGRGEEEEKRSSSVAEKAATRRSSEVPSARPGSVLASIAPERTGRAPNRSGDTTEKEDPADEEDDTLGSQDETLSIAAVYDEPVSSTLRSSSRLGSDSRSDRYSSFGESGDVRSSKPRRSSASTARPRNGTVGTPAIVRNRYGDRLDPPFSVPSKYLLQRIRRYRLCNSFYLTGQCDRRAQDDNGGEGIDDDAWPGAGPWESCPHSHHDVLSPDELETLRVVARSIPCRAGVSCDDPNCYSGHICYRELTGRVCARQHCRFSNAMHGVDKQPVDENGVATSGLNYPTVPPDHLSERVGRVNRTASVRRAWPDSADSVGSGENVSRSVESTAATAAMKQATKAGLIRNPYPPRPKFQTTRPEVDATLSDESAFALW